MPPVVPHDVLKDALDIWKRIRRWTDLNNYLGALRSTPVHRPPPSKEDPYSLRLARRVTELVDNLTARADVPPEEDITPCEALLALTHDVYLTLFPSGSLPAHPRLSTGIPLMIFDHNKYPSSCSIAAHPNRDFASHAAEGNDSAVSYLHDNHSAAIIPRSASGATIMEGLYILTCPSVQLRIDKTVARLRERVEEIERGGGNGKFTHAPGELRELKTTSMLLDDFEEIYRRLLAIFPYLLTMDTPHIPLSLMPVIYELYYQMGEWALEADLTAKAKPGTIVRSFNEERKHFILTRPDGTFPWGLQFNDEGKLIGVSAMVRAASITGEKLHAFLQARRGTVSITACNFKPLDLTNLNNTQAVEKITASAPTQKRLIVNIEWKSDGLQNVEQLAFYSTEIKPDKKHNNNNSNNNYYFDQAELGQENFSSSLRIASLVLQRANYTVSWDVAITRDLVVVGVPNRILSKEVEAFFARYPRQIRVIGINGVEVTDAVQVESLSSTVETIVLDLQTMPSQEEQDKLVAQTGGTTMKEASREKLHPAAESSSLPSLLLAQEEVGSGRHIIQNDVKKKSLDDTAAENSEMQPPAFASEKTTKAAIPPPPPRVERIEGEEQEQRKMGLENKKKKTALKEESPTRGSTQKVMTSPQATKIAAAAAVQNNASLDNPCPSRKETIKEVNRKKPPTLQKPDEPILRDEDIAALQEKPLVSFPSKELKSKVHVKRVDITNDTTTTTTTTKSGLTGKNNLLKKTTISPFLSEDFTPSVDGDGVAEAHIPRNEMNNHPISTLSSLHKQESGKRQPPVAEASPPSGSDMSPVKPLKFPNDVTLNVLTPEEMVVTRRDAEKKWGLSVEKVGSESNRTIRVVGLPLLMDQQQLQHPFCKLFASRKGDWIITSVNGTPTAKLPEVLDIMKHALHMHIRFLRKW